MNVIRVTTRQGKDEREARWFCDCGSKGFISAVNVIERVENHAALSHNGEVVMIKTETSTYRFGATRAEGPYKLPSRFPRRN